MSKLLVENKDIAVPGEVLAEGMDYLPSQGTYRFGDNIMSKIVGLVNIEGRAIKLIPLKGRYMPKRNDVILAKVVDITMSGWRVDTNSAYTAMLSMKDATSEFIARGADLTKYYEFGDWLVCKVVNVTSQNLVDVSMKGPGLRKLPEGRIFFVNSNKVPRIIGKKGSMVSMIKQATDCKLIVGQNGVVWVKGEDPKMELLAVNTIKEIEENSHISGLTDIIKEGLEKATGRKLEELQ